MAVMASTVSEPLSLDLKIADAPVEKALQLNGHVEPEVPAAEPTSLINGSAKHAEVAPTNGVTPEEVSEVSEVPATKPAQESLTEAAPVIEDAANSKPATEATPELGDKPEVPEAQEAPAQDIIMEDVAEDIVEDAKEVLSVEPVAPVAPVTETPVEDSALTHEETPVEASIEEPVDAPIEIPIEIPMEAPAEPDVVPPPEPPVESLSHEAKEDVEMANAEPAAPAEPVNGDALAPTASPRDPDTFPGISQLDLNSTPNESFSAPPTAETTMADIDAPERLGSPVKVARERDDDSIDEPLAKRAKTDSQADEVMAEVPAAPEPRVSVPFDMPGWDDAELLASKISDFQRREFRKIITGLKKTKAGGNFRDSVEKLWPMLWESYSVQIERPSDLSHIDRSLRDHAIHTMGDLKREVCLIYENSLTFNGADHDVTRSARVLVEQTWTKIREIPAEEPPRSKPAPKQMPTRHAEPRTVAQPPPPPPPRRQSAGAASSPTEKVPPAETYAVPPSGVPQVRRASTQNDGDRPKRAIHPPKNKDLDYTPKTINKKKLPPELRFCHEVLEELRSEKHLAINGPFLQPVDPVALGIPTYFNVIKKPMDLETVAGKLAKGEYSSAKDFEKDVMQIFRNCYKFNGTGNPVTAQGKQLESVFKNEWSKKDQWIRSVQKADSAETPSSHSDAETDEEEEEEAAPSAAVLAENAALANAVAELGARLQEETTKLNAMFLEDAPNQTMITVQQSVVQTIQQSLLAEKAKLTASQQKSDKPAKAKPAKASKPKASKPKAAGTKKAAGGAPATAKKAGGSKKVLTATDKDAIASAINDLESPHIEQAIDLIKRDTGQAENDSGELELDIDMLSNDCLLKLWHLCKKVLPGFGRDGKAAAAAAAAAEAAPAPAPKASSGTKSGKPKKNKPMSAREQEQRIAELRNIRDMYKTDSKGGQEAPGGPGSAMDARGMDAGDESSEDSDSEEE